MSTLLLTHLGVICPQCDHLNAPGVLKCESCSASTMGAVVGAPAPPAAASVNLASTAGAKESVPPGMRPNARPAAPTASAHRPAAPPALAPARRPTAAASVAALTPLQAPVALPLAAHLATPGAPGLAPKATPGGARFGLVVLSGSARGQRFRLPQGAASIGKSRGAILFPDDPHVAAHHATVMAREGRLVLRDEGSVSGTYVTVRGEEPLSVGGMFIAGQRLFRYAGELKVPSPRAPGVPADYGAPFPNNQPQHLLEELLVGARPGRAAISAGPVLSIGRASCDLTYPEDDHLAQRHCELIIGPTGASLRDVSGGGSLFIRVAPRIERPLHPGDRVQVGQQLLQVEQLT